MTAWGEKPRFYTAPARQMLIQLANAQIRERRLLRGLIYSGAKFNRIGDEIIPADVRSAEIISQCFEAAGLKENTGG